MNFERARRSFAAICFIVAFTMSAAPKESVGTPAISGSSITWRVHARGHEQVVLVVATPDGDTLTREFLTGRDPSFNLAELDQLVDGAYTYELRVVPKVSDDVKRRLAATRVSNDEKAARKIRKDAGLFEPVIQSGVFTVMNGAILPVDGVEGDANDVGAPTSAGESNQRFGGVETTARSFTPVVNDQVIPDDLIVQGSGCFGFDCVNNESFGFDTIRLKENNLRIKAEDTSVGSFPTNDWQLTFNDSASGGANKFSVEDITGAKVPMTITAGASTNSMFIDSTGRVGFRTSTPVLDLHVATSNTPALRLEQNNAGGFTAQTWDIGANEANFFVRDVTGGSLLPFRIRPGAPTSSIDINSAGNVGIGTASPAVKLDIRGTAAVTEGDFGIGTTAPAAAFHVVDAADISTVGRIQNTSATGFSGISYFDNGGNSRLYVGTDNANSVSRIASFGTFPMVFVTSNVERARFLTSGNLGIGTTTPLSKLHVNGGDIRVSGGSFIDDGTTLSVPDYVFEDSYTLMPLPQLAKFIREQKHLPNVPSAAQVKQNGLNMSQMQMRLLEKVEELTLYTLEQHETIASLREQNDELKARLEKIEALLQQQ